MFHTVTNNGVVSVIHTEGGGCNKGCDNGQRGPLGMVVSAVPSLYVVQSDMMITIDENEDSCDSDEDFQFIWPEPKHPRSPFRVPTPYL